VNDTLADEDDTTGAGADNTTIPAAGDIAPGANATNTSTPAAGTPIGVAVPAAVANTTAPGLAAGINNATAAGSPVPNEDALGGPVTVGNGTRR
jgi:hypothetical protein